MINLLEPPLRFFSLYLAGITAMTFLHLTLWGLLFAALLLGLGWLARRYAMKRSWRNLAVICGGLAIGMNLSYQAMAGAVPAVRNVRYDAPLLALDRLLLGETPSVLMMQWVTPWLTELMSLCYIFFMPLLFFSLLRYFFCRRELLGEFYTGLFTVYGLGFLGYLLVPAAGPWIAYPELFGTTLEGGFITRMNQAMVVEGSNRVDVWPSLHCAVSVFILGFAWRHHRREFWGLLLPVAGLWLSTFYLRYHYLVDVISGFALAAFALYESRHHLRFLPHLSAKGAVHDAAA